MYSIISIKFCQFDRWILTWLKRFIKQDLYHKMIFFALGQSRPFLSGARSEIWSRLRLRTCFDAIKIWKNLNATNAPGAEAGSGARTLSRRRPKMDLQHCIYYIAEFSTLTIYIQCRNNLLYRHSQMNRLFLGTVPYRRRKTNPQNK